MATALAPSVMVMILGSGCGAPWAVVQRSGPPSALRGATTLVVASDFTRANMDGMPGAQAIAALPADEQADVQGMLSDMQQQFATEFTEGAQVSAAVANGPPAPGEVRVTMVVLDITRGGHGPFSSASALHVQLSFSVGGQITDMIEITKKMKWSVVRPSVAQRQRMLSAQMAHLGLDFFHHELRR